MAGFFLLLFLPIGLSVILSVWFSRRESPRWPLVALVVGFLHGTGLWGLLVLGEWRSEYGATDAAIGALAIALAGVPASGIHFIIDGIVVLLLRRIRDGRRIRVQDRGSSGQ